jgi:hypothetical protein
MCHARNWNAGVRSAGILVIDDGGTSGLAAACTVALLITVTEIRIGTRSASGDGNVRDSASSVTAICSARILVVDHRRGTGNASARLTKFVTVTQRGIVARTPVGRRGVLDADGCVARIRSARIPIVDVERDRRGTTAGCIALFCAIADIRIGAQRAARHGRMQGSAIAATVRSAGIAVVDD